MSKEQERRCHSAPPREKNIVCPLYKGAEAGKSMQIRCEGLYRGSNVIQRFSRRRDFDTHLGYCCNRYYRYCEIYRAVASAKGYDEEE